MNRPALLIALLVLSVSVLPTDAVAQAPKRDIAEYERLLKIQEAEYERLKKMREATIDAMVGSNVKYPGVPNAWDDFSINPEINDDPQCAFSYYDPLVKQTERDLEAARKIVKEIRHPPKQRPPGATGGGSRPPATAGTSTAAPPNPPVATPPPLATTEPPPPATTEPPPPTTTAPPPPPPGGDKNCLCRCACAGAGFNVNNIQSYYSTSPVHHTNPDGKVSESCKNPANGPCVCQGNVCRRAGMPAWGTCAEGCTL